MRFFKLTPPDYETDHEAERFNPVRSVGPFQLPGVNCPVCGTWSSDDRLRLPFPESILVRFSEIRFLGVEEWKAAAERWADEFGVPVSSLSPGAELGPPHGETIGPMHEQVVHPFPGLVWVSETVRQILVTSQLAGVAFAKVVFSGEWYPPSNFFEIVPLGRGWRVGSTEESLKACDECGRQIFPQPKVLNIDLSRWDGSDFLNLDSNPNMLFVTERVRDVLVTNGVTNIKFEEIEAQ